MDDPSDPYWNDPSWSWPHWKFGLKRKDLFTTLHTQYNTIPTPILDPEAFHHDVYELAHQAATSDEFHRLLRNRKQQRIRELNETLESAAFEIIANPSLIGPEQWQHAVQLFRTKSFDSIVRYFASYLPADHPWYKSADSSSSPEAGSPVDSLADSHGSLLDDDGPIMTDEPFEYESTSLKQVLPPSPRSMTMCSDSSVASPIGDAHHDFDFTAPTTPARTLSFSESEPDCCDMPEPHTRHDNGRVSHCASISKTAGHGVKEEVGATPQVERDNSNATLQLPCADSTDSETPTPKPEAHSASFFDDTKPSLLPHRRYRSLSPSRPHPLAERDIDHILATHRDPILAVHRDPRNPQRRNVRRERECSPVQRRRRGPAEAATRIQKPLSEAARSRPRARRWVDS